VFLQAKAKRVIKEWEEIWVGNGSVLKGEGVSGVYLPKKCTVNTYISLSSRLQICV
jgi:hypothetical protein